MQLTSISTSLDTRSHLANQALFGVRHKYLSLQLSLAWPLLPFVFLVSTVLTLTKVSNLSFQLTIKKQ